MPVQLRYLVREICAGVEIYFTGRSDGQYLKTAFVLCDDYTELTSKLFLMNNVSRWSDIHDKEARKFAEAEKRIIEAAKVGKLPDAKDINMLEKGKGRDRFKSYHDVLSDVQKFMDSTPARITDRPHIKTIIAEMKERREKRNRFFHSAELLAVNVTRHDCVEAFCDLFDYGKLLFGSAWDSEVSGASNLETLHTLLSIEKKSIKATHLTPKLNKILGEWPCNGKARTKGTIVTAYPEDMHLRLCVVHGGPELRDSLLRLLESVV